MQHRPESYHHALKSPVHQTDDVPSEGSQKFWVLSSCPSLLNVQLNHNTCASNALQHILLQFMARFTRAYAMDHLDYPDTWFGAQHGTEMSQLKHTCHGGNLLRRPTSSEQ